MDRLETHKTAAVIMTTKLQKGCSVCISYYRARYICQSQGRPRFISHVAPIEMGFLHSFSCSLARSEPFLLSIIFIFLKFGPPSRGKRMLCDLGSELRVEGGLRRRYYWDGTSTEKCYLHLVRFVFLSNELQIKKKGRSARRAERSVLVPSLNLTTRALFCR